MRRITSPEPGVGMGTSSHFKTSGLPRAAYRTACIVFDIFERLKIMRRYAEN